MLQKAVSLLYKIFCIGIWAGTMSVLALIIILLCIGERQSPEFQLNSLTLTQGENYDQVLCSHTSDTSGWYKAEYDITLTGAVFSPYTYTASSAVYKPMGQHRAEVFLAPMEELTYSKLSPASFTLTLYIKAADIKSARDIAMEANLGLRGVKQKFSFFSKDIKMNFPDFSVSSFDIEPVTA